MKRFLSFLGLERSSGESKPGEPGEILVVPAAWPQYHIDVHTVLKNYLMLAGFDGLRAPDGECGCLVGDLAPCGQCCLDCLPGHRVDGADGWRIVAGRRVRPDPEPPAGTGREVVIY